MSISGKGIAIVLSDNFDANQFNTLHKCLSEAGALISTVGETAGKNVKDFNQKSEVTIEVSYSEAHSYNFAAVIISNGFSPDKVRANAGALSFVKDMVESGKVAGAIDHGAQVLITLDVLKDKNVTGSPSIKVDLENAGAKYFDEPVVIDENIVTGRGQADIEAFCNAIVDEFKGKAERVA